MTSIGNSFLQPCGKQADALQTAFRWTPELEKPFVISGQICPFSLDFGWLKYQGNIIFALQMMSGNLLVSEKARKCAETF